MMSPPLDAEFADEFVFDTADIVETGEKGVLTERIIHRATTDLANQQT